MNQMWIAGNSGIRKNLEYVTNASRNFVDSDGNLVGIVVANLSNLKISGVGTVGYSVTDNSLSGKQYRYGDSLGVDISDEFESSDILIQFKDYADTDNQYSSNLQPPIKYPV